MVARNAVEQTKAEAQRSEASSFRPLTGRRRGDLKWGGSERDAETETRGAVEFPVQVVTFFDRCFLLLSCVELTSTSSCECHNHGHHDGGHDVEDDFNFMA